MLRSVWKNGFDCRQIPSSLHSWVVTNSGVHLSRSISSNFAILSAVDISLFCKTFKTHYYKIPSYTQSNRALMIIKTPITLMIVAMMPRKFSQDGTLSMRIQPIRIFTAVLINAEIIIFLFSLCYYYHTKRCSLYPLNNLIMSPLY